MSGPAKGGWRKNSAGVKDGASCYRTINGVVWPWWAEPAYFFKGAGVRHRAEPSGQGTFIHPDDEAKAEQAIAAFNATNAQAGGEEGE